MTRIEQEPDQVPRRLVRLAALAIALTIAASAGAALLLGGRGLPGISRTIAPPPDRPDRIDAALFEAPTEAERAAVRARERLHRYGWVDRSRGTVHVPLEVAIELYLDGRVR